MPTLESVNTDALVTMLKGEPGTRKSTCALSWPTPQYWFSYDKKMEALILPMRNWGIKAADVHYDDYTDWAKAEAKMKQLQLTCNYKTIVVDSITSMGDGINQQTKGTKRDEGQGKKIAGIAVNSIEDFNAEASAFMDALKMLKDISKYHKVNVILIAHVVGQRKDDPNNKSTHHSRIIITGGDKISGKISSYMTEVYHFNVESSFSADTGEGKFTLYTHHTGNDYARTSLPLERKITFNDEPLYPNYIKKAIDKLNISPSKPLNSFVK